MKIECKNLSQHLTDEDWEGIEKQRLLAWQVLVERSGPGSEYTAWMDLPISYDREEFKRIQEAAEKIREQSDLLIVAGIGGSYLGARAVIEALRPPFPQKDELEIIFAGHNMSPSYHAQLLSYLDQHEVSLNVISKSGTTTETAVAFRFLRAYLEKRYGEKEAAKRIFVTTDRQKGALRHLSNEKAYESFVVPDDIGGRFSVLTAVGLLPIAAAGIDIASLMEGAADQRRKSIQLGALDCPSAIYAGARNLLARRGYEVELLASFEPQLAYFEEWWKQLFGESEGKNGKGIFPASAIYSTDLHSLGQFIQDGKRILFETFLSVQNSECRLCVPENAENADGLDYLVGMDIKEIQRRALHATEMAHLDGGVPNIRLDVDHLTAETMGALIYFFEKACGLSAYLNGVNPFNQPGVEAYKKNMFALLGKPGFEEMAKDLERRS